MPSDYYKEILTETVNKLVDIRGDIFDLLFNLAVTGELKEWADDVPVGESFHINKEVFEGCDDANIQLVVKLLNNTESTIDSLMNLNNLNFHKNQDEEDN